MLFLGIDQSLTGTGLCLLSPQGNVVTSATITTAGRRDGDRLAFIKRGVASLLAGVTGAAVEGYSYNSTGHVFELGEIGGVVKVLLVEHAIPYISVPPVLVKKFATGNSHADKRAMMSAAAARRGAAFADDDQADAFFLAHIALAYAQNTAETRRELDVLATLRRPPQRKTKRRVRRLIPNAV